MLRICLALLAGAYSLHFCRALPSGDWLAPAIVVGLIGLATRRSRFIAVALLGFCIAWQASQAVLTDRLASNPADTVHAVVGVIADFPERRGRAWRFVLETRGAVDVPSRIRLSWYDAETAPRLGETWALEVRLRRPRGFANPVGFDYEQWLFRQSIGATGYVVRDASNRRLESVPVAARARLRDHVARRIVAVVGDNDASAVLQAITVGARHRISRQQWDRYAATGTSHLVAISGLHVGLAACGTWIACWALLAAICRWRNLRVSAAIAAALSAAAYASLSGFAVPVQRASLMVLAAIVAGVLRRESRAEQTLSLAAIGVFLADPLSILAPGFKLSFAAVAILLWSSRQRRFVDARAGAKRRFADLVARLSALQVTLLLGLLPLTAIMFGRVAWLAPLINILVLPFFNLLTVPTALLGVLLDGPLHPVGDVLLQCCWASIRLMLWLIECASTWPSARGHVATDAPLLPLASLLAALWAVLPPGWPGRRLAWIAALAVLVARPSPPPAGCVDIASLDVGQGLSVVLRTHRRTAVFDTGPAFLSGGDAGRLVLVPYLRGRGLARIDLLIVSHADADHAGGAASLVSTLEVAQILAGEYLGDVRQDQLRCRRGQAWRWDGVHFAIMHPGTARAGTANDRSCVLEVSAGEHRFLLTGDIEADVESRLLAEIALRPVAAAVVPHHGSRTSSIPPFVRRLRADLAIVSAGFDNRWGLPDERVTRRWERTGARVVNTAVAGAIEFRICARGGLDRVRAYRLAARKYWHDPPTE